MYRSLAFALLALAALTITRFETLTAAPGPDQAGVWVEATWLRANGFDYQRLHQEPVHADEGGPRCYVTSILPTIAALLMNVAPSVHDAIPLYRLLMFAMAVLAAWAASTRAERDLDGFASWLPGIALLTTPLFLTHTEVLGLEGPMAACAAMTSVAIGRGRLVAAVLWALATFAMKNNGIAVAVAVFAYIIVLLVLELRGTRLARRSTLLGALGLASAALALEVWVLWWGNAVAGRMIAAITLFPMVLVCSPDLVVVAAGAALHLPRVARSLVGGLLGPADITTGGHFELSRPPIWAPSIFHWLVVVATCLAVTQVTYHPHYLIVVIPFLHAELIRAAAWIGGRHGQRVAIALLSTLIAFNLMNLSGRFFPALPPELSAVATFAGRSHEYWREAAFNREVVRILVEQRDGAPIFAPESTLRYIAFPSLGLVDKPLAGYTAWPNFPSADFKYIGKILDDRPPSVIVAATALPFETNEGYTFAGPFRRDQVLVARESPLRQSVYRHTFVNESTDVDPYDQFVAEQLEPSDVGYETAVQLSRAGHPGVLRIFQTRHPEAVPAP